MTSWRFVENPILNGETTSHDAKCQDPPNVAPVSPHASAYIKAQELTLFPE